MSLACHRLGHVGWRAEEERFLVAGSTVAVVVVAAVVAVVVAVVVVVGVGAGSAAD